MLTISTGRTARIGNEGIATSFYNERNEDIAYDLVKILMESKQTIPDFLEPYRPENDELDFDDNSEDEFFDQQEEEAGFGDGSEAGDKADSQEGDAEKENQPVSDEVDDPFVDSNKSKKEVDDWKDSENESRSSKPPKVSKQKDDWKDTGTPTRPSKSKDSAINESAWAPKNDDFWGAPPSKADRAW